MTIRYEGQNPGPPFLNHAEVLAAQLTDFLWARAMGDDGDQLDDSEGVSMLSAQCQGLESKLMLCAGQCG